MENNKDYDGSYPYDEDDAEEIRVEDENETLDSVYKEEKESVLKRMNRGIQLMRIPLQSIV